MQSVCLPLSWMTFYVMFMFACPAKKHKVCQCRTLMFRPSQSRRSHYCSIKHWFASPKPVPHMWQVRCSSISFGLEGFITEPEAYQEIEVKPFHFKIATTGYRSVTVLWCKANQKERSVLVVVQQTDRPTAFNCFSYASHCRRALTSSIVAVE